MLFFFKVVIAKSHQSLQTNLHFIFVVMVRLRNLFLILKYFLFLKISSGFIYLEVVLVLDESHG